LNREVNGRWVYMCFLQSRPSEYVIGGPQSDEADETDESEQSEQSEKSEQTKKTEQAGQAEGPMLSCISPICNIKFHRAEYCVSIRPPMFGSSTILPSMCQPKHQYNKT
jgi:hypothetical protein